MVFDPNKNHRRSIRLPEHDYSAEGLYFITICTQERLCLFGDILENKMIHNDAGLMIARTWKEMPNKFNTISMGEHVVMPNHLHGIIKINKSNLISVAQIIQYFKSVSNYHYSLGVKKFSWETYPGRLWQRNYYEHVIRDEESLNRINEYIICNPQEWGADKDNPINMIRSSV